MIHVSLHDIGPQQIVAIRERVPQAGLPAFLGRAFGELYSQLGMLGVPPGGHPFVIYHAFGPDGIDAEACAPVSRDVAASGQVHARILPALKVARTLHLGPYEELAATYAALGEWIREHHLEVAGPVRERYLTGVSEGVAPTQYRTEIEMPVETAAVAVA